MTLSDLLTLYRAVLRAHTVCALLPVFVANYASIGGSEDGGRDRRGEGASKPSADTDTHAGIAAMHAELSTNVAKCDKFLALVEELVDLQRIQDTYGSRNTTTITTTTATSTTTTTATTTTTTDGTDTNTDTNNPYADEEPSSGSIFRDKWVRVRPSFTPLLTSLHSELHALQAQMHAEHCRVADLCSDLDKPPAKKARIASTSTSGSNSKVVMLEHTEVHGPHFRVTKRLSNNVLKIINSSASSGSGTGTSSGKLKSSSSVKGDVTVLSNQKAGTLFLTPQVIIAISVNGLYFTSLLLCCVGNSCAAACRLYLLSLPRLTSDLTKHLHYLLNTLS